MLRSWGHWPACIYIYACVCAQLRITRCTISPPAPKCLFFRRLLYIQPPRAFSLCVSFVVFFVIRHCEGEKKDAEVMGRGESVSGDGLLWAQPSGPETTDTLGGFASICLQDKDLLRRKLLVTNPYYPQRVCTGALAHTLCQSTAVELL